MLLFPKGAETTFGAQGNRAAIVFGSQRTGRFKEGKKITKYSLVRLKVDSTSKFLNILICQELCAVEMEQRR